MNLFESGFHVNDPTWTDENEFFKVTKHNNIKNTVVAIINLSDLRFVNIVDSFETLDQVLIYTLDSFGWIIMRVHKGQLISEWI